ncbi:MAG: hypothetical protein R3F02_02135 [Thiolinea sp.]
MQTALNAGESRPKTAQPLRAPAIIGAHFPESDLSYAATPNGVLVTHNGLMVAWIYQGYAGARNNPNRCEFFDVAFPSLSFDPQNRITGMMLDSASFDTVAAALAFIEATFGEVQA